MTHEIFDPILRAFGGAAYATPGKLTTDDGNREYIEVEIKVREADRNGPAEYAWARPSDAQLAEAVRRILETHCDELEETCVELIEQGWPHETD